MNAINDSLSIGKKIGIGFALILAILIITGAYSVFSMRGASQGAAALREDYIPEFTIVSELQQNLGEMMTNSRGYALTGDEGYYKSSIVNAADVELCIEKLQALSDKSTRLVKLKEDIHLLPEAYATFEKAFDDTHTAIVDLDKARVEAAKSGDVAEISLRNFIEGQDASMAAELNGQLNKQKLEERLLKIRLASKIMDQLDELRTKNFQSQALRKPSMLLEAMPLIEEMENQLNVLRPIVRQPANIKQLAELSQSIAAYKTAMDIELAATKRLEKLSEARLVASEKLSDTCVGVMKAAAKGTNTIADDSYSNLNKSSLIMMISLIVAVVVGALIATSITRIITRPLADAVDFVQRIANRDLMASLEVKSHDEIGRICTALNEMAKGLRGNLLSISHSAQSLSASSEELSAVSEQVSSNAEETANQANVVSAAAEQVSRNVSTVATGSEEMTASIREIAKNSSDAAKVANNAASIAEKANATIAKLDVSSIDIGKVIKVITSIAEQTNLLALNATIEAARAGEAGKGFAVVANEVKELAKQTAKATEEIGTKIKTIQMDTQGAVSAIREISAIINQINQIQTVIAGSVEEQAATTNEISKNVSEAAKGASEIARNIGTVSTAAKGTTEGAGQTAAAANELARLATELTGVVGLFKLESGSIRRT